MLSDKVLARIMVKDKVFSFVGKMLIMESPNRELPKLNKYVLTLVGFSEEEIIKPLKDPVSGSVELIEGEVIVIPKRIRRNNKELFGLDITQMLNSAWSNPENWKETEETNLKL